MQQLTQVKERSFPSNLGEVNFSKAEDGRLEATRARFSNVLKRHGELTERLSRDSDKMIFERLQREFESACASQTQETTLDGEQWNDGLLATIRERVHMEAERRAIQLSGETTSILSLPFLEKIRYKVGNKMICCLDGARIGIQYEISFAGEPLEIFHCILESKSFLEKMTVLEHTVPFFLPIREAESDFLSSNAIKFVDHVGDLLQSYVDRREQVTVSLRYVDLVSVLPSTVSVLAWPLQKLQKSTGAAGNDGGVQPIPAQLPYAEDALRSMSLPEAFAEIVLNMPKALREKFLELKSA